MVDLSRIIEKFPAIIPREDDSTIARYIEAFQEEADDFGEDLSDIRESRFIDKATGSDLDRIGRMYGPLGRRAGRDDTEYRKYLKSLVPVFQYRGTVPGIKEAVAAGLDIESGVNGDSAAPAELSVYEHYNDDPANLEEYLEYTITLEEWPEHRGSTIEELAELSDASVSRLRKVRYDIEPDEAGVGDGFSITEGQLIADAASASDAVFTNQNLTEVVDNAEFDDATLINPNLTTVADAAEFDDPFTSHERVAGKARWDQQRVDWDFFEWAVIEELTRALTDEVSSDDATFVNPNLTTVAGGTGGSDDANQINPNLTTTSDTAFSSDTTATDANLTTVGDNASADDATTVDGDTTTVAEDTTASETVTTTETIVSWDDGSWDSMNWAVEHN